MTREGQWIFVVQKCYVDMKGEWHGYEMIGAFETEERAIDYIYRQSDRELDLVGDEFISANGHIVRTMTYEYEDENNQMIPIKYLIHRTQLWAR